jgi:hypothetical protein
MPPIATRGKLSDPASDLTQHFKADDLFVIRFVAVEISAECDVVDGKFERRLGLLYRVGRKTDDGIRPK